MNIKTLSTLLSLLLLTSCTEVLQETTASISGANNRATSSGQPGLPFIDTFDINYPDVTDTECYLPLPPSPGSEALNGSLIPPSSGLSVSLWSNPFSVDLSTNYQQIEVEAVIVPTADIYILSISTHFNLAQEAGYACVLFHGAGDLYYMSILRVSGAVAAVAGPVSSTIDSNVQGTTPFLAGCETVEVSGTFYIKGYLGANVGSNLVEIISYAIGSDVINDSSIIEGNHVGLAMWANDHKINSYEIRASK